MTSLNEPVLRTRFTDMGAALMTSQNNDRCKDFELRYVYCKEAYGKTLSDTKCNDLKEDLRECIFQFKQLGRAFAMQDERLRQYRAGERSKEGYYGPIPPADSY